MESEDIFKSQGSSAPIPAAKVTSDGEKTSDPKDELVQFSDHASLNVSQLLLWLAAIVAIVGTISFWFMNRSLIQGLADKNTEKANIVSQIASPTYSDVETKATSFRSAVTQLQSAVKSRYSMSDFTPKFYTQINKNVTVTNLSVGGDGKLSFDGTTDSYKSVAAQIATLSAWSVDSSKVLSNVSLLSVSEDVTKGVVVKFAISAQIDTSVKLATASATATTTTSGGN